MFDQFWAKTDINSLNKCCEGNVFEENQARGVRQLDAAPELLSKIDEVVK